MRLGNIAARDFAPSEVAALCTPFNSRACSTTGRSQGTLLRDLMLAIRSHHIVSINDSRFDLTLLQLRRETGPTMLLIDPFGPSLKSALRDGRRPFSASSARTISNMIDQNIPGCPTTLRQTNLLAASPPMRTSLIRESGMLFCDRAVARGEYDRANDHHI